jgi:hypothetical protein
LVASSPLPVLLSFSLFSPVSLTHSVYGGGEDIRFDVLVDLENADEGFTVDSPDAVSFL